MIKKIFLASILSTIKTDQFSLNYNIYIVEYLKEISRKSQPIALLTCVITDECVTITLKILLTSGFTHLVPIVSSKQIIPLAAIQVDQNGLVVFFTTIIFAKYLKEKIKQEKQTEMSYSADV